MTSHLIFGCLLAAAFVLGVVVGVYDQLPLVRRLRGQLATQRENNAHRLTSLARKDDEIDVLNARLLEANAELVILRGDDDLPPEAA